MIYTLLTENYMITYGDLQVSAPPGDIEDCIAYLGTLTRPEKRKMMTSVNRAITHVLAEVKRGAASQKVAIDCAQDIAIWFANEVAENRTTFP